MHSYSRNYANEDSTPRHASQQGPELSIGEPDVNLGLARLGECVSRRLTLCNPSPIAAQFEVLEERSSASASASSSDAGGAATLLHDYELRLTPTSGVIAPMLAIDVNVEFLARAVGVLRSRLCVRVANGTS